MILREILSLENGDGFELILSYDDENDEPWKTAQIRKRICGVEADELLDVESGILDVDDFAEVDEVNENGIYEYIYRFNRYIKQGEYEISVKPYQIDENNTINDFNIDISMLVFNDDNTGIKEKLILDDFNEYKEVNEEGYYYKIPFMNKSDNSFAQPNFDQYSVNMMYGSNTEEEQYLRMQKEQLQPAKAFDKANTPLPGAGSNVGSDFGNTYGNGLNNNTNINAYQNNLQKGPQMQQPQSRPQMNAPYIAPQAPQMQQPQTTFGSQLNPNTSMDQAPQANASKAKDPMKKKSPVGKVIAVIVILLILGALGYIFYPYIMNFINSKSDDGSTTENTIIRQPLSSNSIVIENTATNAISNETVNNITENTIGNATATETNGVGNTTANETTSNTINLNTTSRNTNSVANTIVLTNSTTQH